MITIRFSNRNHKVDQWVDVLEEVVLSHQLVKDKSLKEPVLNIGKEVVKGERDISRYVDQLKKDMMRTWAAC